LGRFHEIKSLRRQVQFEEKWLKQAFSGVGYEREVTEALLDRWDKDRSFLVSDYLFIATFLRKRLIDCAFLACDYLFILAFGTKRLIECAFMACDYLLIIKFHKKDKLTIVSFHQKEQVTLSLACELMSTDTVLMVQFTEHSSERSNAYGFLWLDSWNVL